MTPRTRPPRPCVSPHCWTFSRVSLDSRGTSARSLRTGRLNGSLRLFLQQLKGCVVISEGLKLPSSLRPCRMVWIISPHPPLLCYQRRGSTLACRGARATDGGGNYSLHATIRIRAKTPENSRLRWRSLIVRETQLLMNDSFHFILLHFTSFYFILLHLQDFIQSLIEY